MKAHRITCLIVDPNHPDTPAQEYASLLENCRYVNPEILSVETADIGEWSDEHPLNLRDTQEAEVKRLFDTPPAPTTTAAEVIARHKELTDQIAALEAERAALPKVALPWVDGTREVMDRKPGDRQFVMVDFDAGEWAWRHGEHHVRDWCPAEPNTEEGAKSCAEAYLSANGVLLA